MCAILSPDHIADREIPDEDDVFEMRARFEKYHKSLEWKVFKRIDCEMEPKPKRRVCDRYEDE